MNRWRCLENQLRNIPTWVATIAASSSATLDDSICPSKRTWRPALALCRNMRIEYTGKWKNSFFYCTHTCITVAVGIYLPSVVRFQILLDANAIDPMHLALTPQPLLHEENSGDKKSKYLKRYIGYNRKHNIWIFISNTRLSKTIM